MSPPSPDFQVGAMLAYQGKDGCKDVRCTRRDGKCIGWHCPYCHAPCSSQGHRCPARPQDRMEPPRA